MVARSRIELPTQGFSGLCSTTELPRQRECARVSYEKVHGAQTFFQKLFSSLLFLAVQTPSIVSSPIQPHDADQTQKAWYQFSSQKSQYE